MKLRGIAILALSVACASEASDPGIGQGPGSFVAIAGSAGVLPTELAEPAGGELEVPEPLTGNLHGEWSYGSARALEEGEGFLLRLYSEPLSKTSDFVPTRDYARLRVPALGKFYAEGAGQTTGGAFAEFILCARPGIPCVGPAVTSQLATGQIRLQRGSSGLLEGSVDLHSGNEFIEGDFDGVESYAAACAADACRCDGRQLERCSWDTSTWRATSCSDFASCGARGLLNRCCGVVQP
jgi:hypothetical protein